MNMPPSFRPETAVRERYAAAAHAPEAALCCPVDYDPRWLKNIPEEVIAKDYGCGDPSQYLRAGETVLDLGSGTGKICFIAAQVVGPTGRVIGVDMTNKMLEVARRNAPLVAERVGYANVEFRKGRIQDLALDLELLDRELAVHPITGGEAFLAAEARAATLRVQQPLVADAAVDVVVSNCVLNLVDGGEKNRLFHEIFRVLRPGGRAVISDIIADHPVPESLRQDSELWSGCISGALTADGFLDGFLAAGFHGVEIVKRDAAPWRTVAGIDFRAVTVAAYKAPVVSGGAGPGEVVYLGPFREVVDDVGRRFPRGRKVPVDGAALATLGRPPYQGVFALLPSGDQPAPVVAKKRDFRVTSNPGECCSGGSDCD